MEKTKLFITGINGTIGRVLQDGLAGEYEVWGLDVNGPYSERVFEANIDAYERVLESFRQALEVDPDSVKARVHLGALLLEVGREGEAVEADRAGQLVLGRPGQRVVSPVGGVVVGSVVGPSVDGHAGAAGRSSAGAAWCEHHGVL